MSRPERLNDNKFIEILVEESCLSVLYSRVVFACLCQQTHSPLLLEKLDHCLASRGGHTA